MSTAMVSDIGQESPANEVERLFRENYQLIYRTAYSITGTRQDAEDVLQTIFLRLLKREEPVDVKKIDSKNYFYRSAVNASLSVLRTRQRQPWTEGAACTEVALPAAEGRKDEPLEQHLIDAVAQLPEQDVEILILRYEHNYSYQQIARLLGKSSGSIAVALYRTRTRLRNLLNEKLGE